MKKKTLNEWVELWHDAVSKRASIDERIKRRYELYNGTDKVRDLQKGGYSKKSLYSPQPHIRVNRDSDKQLHTAT